MRHEVIKSGEPIHPAWCTCSDCSLERRGGSYRPELLMLALGASSGVSVAVLLWLAPIVASAIRELF